ncbi:serine/threonine-protein phosphatase 7 long form-like protein [Senna tora]|uniref:Serine/threonine-protein phosphatase 7 long form-like protein n=1 Tax=Senna tora TaxID=362788 RepID=A0A834TSR0_9FABA|nr:serine/threonine-protein phosphatase 7 long form-like protein [Senna tora]
MQLDMSSVSRSIALHNSLYKYASTVEPQLKMRTAIRSANGGRYIRYNAFDDLSGIKCPPMSFKMYAHAKCAILTIVGFGRKFANENVSSNHFILNRWLFNFRRYFHRMVVPRQTIIHPRPEDPSLLTLQKKHISEHVRQGYPELVLRCQRSSKDHPRLPPQLIFNVLKLPCVGVPIVGRTYLPWATVCEGLLGHTPLEVVNIEHFAQAYILKLIGGYLMPDKSSKEWTCIDIHYHQRYDTLKKYRLLLNSLKEDQIKWRPYDEDHVSQQIPHYCIDNRHIWRANVPLICFHIVDWQYSDRVLRQFGMDQPIPENPCGHRLPTHLKIDMEHIG